MTFTEAIAEALHPEWCPLCPTDPVAETSIYLLQLAVRSLHDGRYLTIGELRELWDCREYLPDDLQDRLTWQVSQREVCEP